MRKMWWKINQLIVLSLRVWIIEIRLECRWNYYVGCSWGPTLGFDTQQKTVFWSNLVFLQKSKILTILFIVKYEKITLFDEFLVMLGPIISRFFACSNEKKTKTTKGACSSPISVVWIKLLLMEKMVTISLCSKYNSNSAMVKQSTHYPIYESSWEATAGTSRKKKRKKPLILYGAGWWW